MRKLATIRTINQITPIEGADRIETAHIGGWPVVIRKGEYNVGDKVVYLEIDSWVPKTLAPFLVKEGKSRVFNGIEGERLRTVKLRGQLSQGLILPLVIPADNGAIYDMRPLEEGEDVSEYLGIQKWERPVPAELRGLIRSNFPSFIPRTDQERIQNMTWVLDDLDKEWELTLKLDGSSITIYAKDGCPGVCSRNLDLKMTAKNAGNAFVKTARESGLIDALLIYESLTNKAMAVQGELCGPGIQDNPLKLKKVQIFLFDVYDINAQRYLTPIERYEFLVFLFTEFNIKNCTTVPTLVTYESWYNKITPHITSFIYSFRTLGISNIEDLLTLTDKVYGQGNVTAAQSLFKDQMCDIGTELPPPYEGIVFKALDGSTSFKAINNNYLLKDK